MALEASGREERAQRALGRVFRALPDPAPSRELVAGVLARLKPDQVPLAALARPARTRALGRAAAAFLLLGSALATAIWLPALVAAVRDQSVGVLIVDLGAGALSMILQRFAAVMTLWDVLARAGTLAVETIATPQLLAFLLMSLLLSLIAFRFAVHTGVAGRSPSHA